MFSAGPRNTAFTSLFHLAYITECQSPHLKSWLNPCGRTEGEKKEKEEEILKKQKRGKVKVYNEECSLPEPNGLIYALQRTDARRYLSPPNTAHAVSL